MSNTKIWAISIVAILAGWVLYVAAPSLKPLLIPPSWPIFCIL